MAKLSKHAAPDVGSPAKARPVARKHVSRSDVTREATRLFAEKGYDGLTMEELATRLGLRKASLFHHFPTKEAIYQHVLVTLIASVDAAVSDALQMPGPHLARLDALSDALTVALGEHPHAARLLVGDSVHGGPLMHEILGTKIDALLNAAREFVRTGQREGAFDRELDPTQVVLTLVGAHFLPFAIEDLVERFAGTRPSHAAFVGARTVAVREQVRRLLGAHREPRLMTTQPTVEGAGEETARARAGRRR